MPDMQDRYLDMLLERIRGDRYPSGQLMDRAEALATGPEQAERVIGVLMEKVDETRYASGQMLDRVERLIART